MNNIEAVQRIIQNLYGQFTLLIKQADDYTTRYYDLVHKLDDEICKLDIKSQEEWNRIMSVRKSLLSPAIYRLPPGKSIEAFEKPNVN